MEKAALPKYRRYFEDYANAPFVINAMISITHGASVELIPSEENKFQCRTVVARIDREVYPIKDPNLASLKRYATNDANRGYASIGPINVTAKSISIRGLSVGGITISETGAPRTKDIIVGGIDYANTILIKGSNQRKSWSRKVAREDALGYFHSDLNFAYMFSEEFREFIATPELTEIAKTIQAKLQQGAYKGKYGYIEFRDDLAVLIAKVTAHGINPEFAKSIYKFLEKDKSWFERHIILTGILICTIFAILVWLFKLYRGWIITFMKSES